MATVDKAAMESKEEYVQQIAPGDMIYNASPTGILHNNNSSSDDMPVPAHLAPTPHTQDTAAAVHSKSKSTTFSVHRPTLDTYDRVEDDNAHQAYNRSGSLLRCSASHIAYQTTANQVQLYSQSAAGFQHVANLQTPFAVTQLALSSKLLVISNTNSSNVACYDLQNADVSHSITKFTAPHTDIQCVDDMIYLMSAKASTAADKPSITCCAANGIVKSTIQWPATDGYPLMFSVASRAVQKSSHNRSAYVAIITDKNILKVYEVSARNTKLIVPNTSVIAPTTAYNSIQSMTMNADGTYVVLLGSNSNVGTFYDLELHRWYTTTVPHQPTSVHFDSQRTDYCVVQCYNRQADTYDLHTYYVLSEEGPVLHDEHQTTEQFVDCNLPYYYYTNSQSSSPPVQRSLTSDFYGLDESRITPEVIQIMNDYTYNLTAGNIEVAYRFIQKLMSETANNSMVVNNNDLWRSLARSCLHTHRYEIALICMSQLGMVNAIHHLQQVMQQYNISSRGADKQAADSKVVTNQHLLVNGMFAMYLGYTTDAEQYYLQAQAYQQLIEFYQLQNRWTDAVELARKHYRIALKTIYYQYGKWLEGESQRTAGADIGSSSITSKALEMYVNAGMQGRELPRLLYKRHEVETLHSYIQPTITAENKTEQAQYSSYLAQYCESQQQWQTAIEYYQHCNDLTSVVRIYCHLQQYDAAEELVQQAIQSLNTSTPTTKPYAAAYYLAQQFEQHQQYLKAMEYYKTANSTRRAITVAQTAIQDPDLSTGERQTLVNELLQLVLTSSDQALQVRIADAMQAAGEMNHAVMLYERCGKFDLALQLCFQNRLFSTLATISSKLNENTDQQLLVRCAEFCMENNEYQQATILYLHAKQYNTALDLCTQHQLPLTDQLVDLFTPPKPAQKNDTAVTTERTRILTAVAELCEQQGLMAQACKKYTQAGDSSRAFKCLLKSADTEKILYYATMTKKVEIYTLAGNYLQTLDFSANPEYGQKIIEFYSKAKRYDLLSTFYLMKSEIAINEYRDYDEGLVALRDALKAAIKHAAGKDDATLQQLNHRIAIVEQFCAARQAVATNPSETIRICGELTADHLYQTVETAVRVGDVYALLVEYFVSVGSYDQAALQLQQMSAKQIVQDSYIDGAVVQQIYTALGVTPT